MSSPKDSISRRGVLAASVGLVAVACSGSGEETTMPSSVPGPSSSTVPVPTFSSDPFKLGVASGDPLHDSVVIWTRLAPSPMDDGGGIDVPATPVRWEVRRGAETVADGEFVTTADHGHSVHIDVTGLEPATTYSYRFSIGDWVSPTGTTRTSAAPGTPVDSLRFAVANCAAWKSGFFTAYSHLADEDLDAVLFVGDYTYELESGNRRDHGLPIPFTLADYRLYYAVARLEPELALAHARHPWIIMWDDHEVEDNYAGWNPGGIGVALDPDAAETFAQRRRAAYQAWWEYMPVRTGPPIDGELRLYRDFEFGDLAKLTLIDDRQYRSPIIAGEGDGALPRPFGGGPQLEATFDTSRTMLGAAQEEWLVDSLRHEATWSLLAQQTIMAQVDRAPDDPSKGFSMDAWDGYAAPRERLLGDVHEAGVENFVVFGGDIHTSAVADLHVSYRDPESPMVGTEFVGPSITSLELLLPEFVEGSRSNPHVHLYETEHRGYLLIDVAPDELITHYRWVDTTQEPISPITTSSSWRVQEGEVGVTKL